MDQEISAIEHEGWQALSTDLVKARAFYEKLLDAQAVMLLPGGIVLRSPQVILASFRDRPWDWFRIENENLIVLGDNVRLIYYQVKSQRKGEEIYEALVTSIYHRQGGDWKLVFHQQTPI